MRNFRTVRVSAIINVEELPNGSCLAVDCETKFVYIATDTSVVVVDPIRKQIVESMKLSDINGSSSVASHVVHIQYLPEQAALCIAMSEGDIILWTASTSQIEVVGTVDQGILTMCWSPDLELVSLTSGLKLHSMFGLLQSAGREMLIMMTKDFDPLFETSLQLAGFGEAEPVTIGWGKKETQFHGSEGKAAAVAKNQNKLSLLSFDDRKPRISWRADGQYFAVSFVNQETEARQIRVWSREGQLHSTSEPTPDLGQSLSYKPSGSLIASSSRRLGKHWITFFEKNGLRHGEFELSSLGHADHVEVVDVAWNLESTVLAVWCRKKKLTSDSGDNFVASSSVTLWTVSNYHWYLKQSLEFPSSFSSTATCDYKKTGEVAAIMWDPEVSLCLHVTCTYGTYMNYRWAWSTDCSHGETSEDLLTVAVIDGDKLLMTPFRSMVVPPPMSAYELCLPSVIHSVTFCAQLTSTSNNILVLLSDATIVIYCHDTVKSEKNGTEVQAKTDDVKVQAAGGEGFQVKCALPNLVGRFSLRYSKSMLPAVLLPVFYHWIWLDSSTVLFCISLCECENDAIVSATINYELNVYDICSVVKMELGVVAIARAIDTGTVAVQLTDGRVFRYYPESGARIAWTTIESAAPLRFPQTCPQMAVCRLGEQEVVIGLTERFRLYVNDIEVANNCTSFAIHSEFLLLTTHAHTCRCINRNTAVAVISVFAALASLSTSKTHIFDESVRSVERGSRIVCVTADDSKVVLQTPRGNLEVIHPRALVLSAIRNLLNKLEYKQAFTLMKKHRINMNLLYDHDPILFLDKTSLFVHQLDSPIDINLFLSALQEEDVTETMYTATYGPHRPSCVATPVPTALTARENMKSKLDVICDALRTTLEDIDSDKYMLSILTTYVKKTVPELENALHRVLALKDSRSNKDDTSSSLNVAVDEALTYLLYHIDVNVLYNVALGTYNLDLVIMVADKSQKDPKEYLAHLNELQRLEENYRKYTIDIQLRRFDKALAHISKCSNRFDECLKLVKEQKLYTRALRLFPLGSSEYQTISVAFGGHLCELGNYEEAGIVFARTNDNQLALIAYEQALNWQQALCMTAQLKCSAKDVTDLSRRLVARLIEERRHVEAALLLEQYCSDCEEAIVVLISGNQWSEALRLIYKYNRLDLIETNLCPSLKDAHSNLITLIESTSAEYQRQTTRLLTVRNQRKATADLIDATDDAQRANCDLFSDTSSVTGYSQSDSQRSVNSRSSGRTNKSRRKHEKRKWTLREGSLHEDLALIEALYKTVTQAEQWKADVSALLKALCLFNNELLAVELQDKFIAFLTVIESSLSLIWTPDLTGSQSQESSHHFMTGPDSTANSITQSFRKGKSSSQSAAVDVDTVQLDPVMRIAPVINPGFSWQLAFIKQ